MDSRETALRVIPRGNVTIVAGTCQEREWLLACEWREKGDFWRWWWTRHWREKRRQST